MWAVEFCREESRNRAQGRVAPHLVLQLSQALGLVGDGAGTVTGVALGLSDPVAQRLVVDAQLIGRCARSPRRVWPDREGTPLSSGWRVREVHRGIFSVLP